MKIIVGLSGGVDSSVAALLLKKQGYDVEALYMRNWDSALNNDRLGNPDYDRDICPQEKDYLDALEVARIIGIKLHRHDFVDEYWRDVFTNFLYELKNGRTPNPDILCNKYIKFSAFIDVAKTLGADKIAMGHYARVEAEDGQYRLLRGIDKNKDQTYFLSQLDQKQLSWTLFPIGGMTKDEVRKLASEFGLPVARKKDSTGICFIGERNFSAFVHNYLPIQPGPIVAEDGKTIGKHEGLMNYTIGQRKGIRVGGLNIYRSEPWFVSGKNLETNTLHVVQGFHNPKLYSNRCHVENFNWILPAGFERNDTLTAKFRYRQPDIAVKVELLESEKLVIDYEKKSRAVTPGQAAVLYSGELCLGGGTITEVYDDGKIRTKD